MTSGVTAQDESTSPDIESGPVIEVTAQDYHFEGLPTSVPAGSSLTLTNAGAELHEIILVRKNDGVTESFDELLALPEEEAFQKVTTAGVLFAAPGESASMGIDATGAPAPMKSITLVHEGEYLAICFIPQGTTEMPDFSAEAPPSSDAACRVGRAAGAATLPARHEAGVHGDRRGERDRPIPSAPAPHEMPAESPAA